MIIMGEDPEGLHNYDREWQKAGGLVSRRNDAMRANYKRHIEAKLGHDPALVEKLTPDFPPFAKRPVVDNGWFDTLVRDNVDLVTDPIERITPKGVRTQDGQEREFDLLLLCAGFKVERYLWPVRYEGRGGVTLEEAWSRDGARGYLGITVPDFPNLFIVYGPNAQPRAGGLIKWLEIWSAYALRSIVKLVEGGHRSMAVRRDVFEHYNARMDKALEDCIWSAAGSYYLNEHGRQNVNMPWKPAQYYEWVRDPDLDDYDLE
jgi:4-hydroxyacetophenone monooxygenase